ncbi:hypothetical protein I204_05888 [Kwoniella mangroviensis CBS 8886]|uniref:uncharacterized protein n=1 Tax=Kwoniella mangroviensis CBS 8507 TaxID=1296122 RepID=UPI00080CE89D|nr:uncharacterized protein I203_07862 [Kwoniella mangroviensis CBS 8507]OCF63126.1 hypothetical protein I203_07862 [Kwoniella mangroviensis CBS 8507]OCF74038.1 hypothetical protein I204_05888 [Kwoniella mangroviensis CBS 8886]
MSSNKDSERGQPSKASDEGESGMSATTAALILGAGILTTAGTITMAHRSLTNSEVNRAYALGLQHGQQRCSEPSTTTIRVAQESATTTANVASWDKPVSSEEGAQEVYVEMNSQVSEDQIPSKYRRSEI